MSRAVGAAISLAAIALVGCGTSESGDVRAATERFLAAVERHDGATACRLLDPDARKAAAEQEHKPCADAIAEVSLKPAKVARVRVYSQEAFVVLDSGENAYLDDRGNGWHVSAIGCKPAGDGPQDCEVEG